MLKKFSIIILYLVLFTWCQIAKADNEIEVDMINFIGPINSTGTNNPYWGVDLDATPMYLVNTGTGFKVASTTNGATLAPLTASVGTFDSVAVDNITINTNALTMPVDTNLTLTTSGTGRTTIPLVDINGGTIDNATIGITTPVAGNFTTIGVTTAGSGAFTTLSSSGQYTNTLAIGTSPFAITSTTVNTNLNSDMLDGLHDTSFAKLASANIFTADQTLDNAGDDTNSYKLKMVAQRSGPSTKLTGSIYAVYGADPYVRFSAPNDSGVETPVFDMKDTAIVFTIDNTVDIGAVGAVGANRPKNYYGSGTGTFGTATIGSGSLNDSSGAISFGDENISTTGTLASGVITATGTGHVFSNAATGSMVSYFRYKNGGANSIQVSLSDASDNKLSLRYYQSSGAALVRNETGGNHGYLALYDTGSVMLGASNTQDLKIESDNDILLGRGINTDNIYVYTDSYDSTTPYEKQTIASYINKTEWLSASGDTLVPTGTEAINTTNGAVDRDLPATTSYTSTVNADSASGQKVLNVTATTNSAVGDTVLLAPGTAREEKGVIASIQAGVSVTFVDNLVYTHTALQADPIYSMVNAGVEKTYYMATDGGANDITVTCQDANDRIMMSGTAYTTITLDTAGDFVTLRCIGPLLWLVVNGYGHAAS